MAGSQRTEVGLESVAKAAGIAVVAVVFARIALDVVGSLARLDLADPIALVEIQYHAIGAVTTVVVIAAVLLVALRGVEFELVAMACGAVYAASFLESLLRELVGPTFDSGVGLFLVPLYTVIRFLGFAVAFYVAESDIVR